jgi:hypothetical protein
VAPFSFSEKEKSNSSNRPPRKDGPRKDGPRKDGPRKDGPRKDGPRKDGPRKDNRGPKRAEHKPNPDKRYRNFAVPILPEDITGDELEKKKRAELRPLAEENALAVAKHLVAVLRFLESDPELAFRHGQEATFRAGRIGLVREYAGLAALRSGRFELAQKDLRAASRISGSKELLPFIAQCEVALGNPRKALEIAGSVAQSELSVSGRVELRIAAAAARSALEQHEAAVVTLRCAELNKGGESWSKRLHLAYFKALTDAGESKEAEEFKKRFPQSFTD